MLNTPFAFISEEVDTGFDPTLGGSVTPYFWYDFTDSGSMAFSASKVIEIDSKGSNTGSLARGTGTKYTTNWIGPEFDAINGYTVFSGSVTTNSALARRYGSGNPSADEGAANGDNNTALIFFQADWDGTSNFYRLANWKGYNTTYSQPEEWSIAAVNNNFTYPGTTYYAATSPSSTINSIVSQKYFPNVSIYYSYSGSGLVNADGIGPWNSWFARLSGTGNTYNAGRTTTEDFSYGGSLSNGSNAIHENLCLGARSKTDEYGGPQFKIRHFLFYDSALTDTQIELLITDYKNNYAGDNLNP